MRKLILAIVLVGFIAATAQAADVVITITIPDAHVARVADAVTNGMDCEGLSPKVCLKREFIQHIRSLIKSYENIYLQQG